MPFNTSKIVKYSPYLSLNFSISIKFQSNNYLLPLITLITLTTISRSFLLESRTKVINKSIFPQFLLHFKIPLHIMCITDEPGLYPPLCSAEFLRGKLHAAPKRAHQMTKRRTLLALRQQSIGFVADRAASQLGSSAQPEPLQGLFVIELHAFIPQGTGDVVPRSS